MVAPLYDLLLALMHVGCGVKFASAGYAVFGLDVEGHGRSAGVRCLITKFDNIVNDASDYFKSICGGDYNGISCHNL